MKILFTGGGTGGHVMPILAISRELRRLYHKENLAIWYMGPRDRQWQLQCRQEDIKALFIVAGKWRRYASLQNVFDVAILLPLGFVQAIFLLLFIQPQLVFSKGGTGSVPVALAARLLGIPLFIHESDVVPGKSNRIAAPWARNIFVSFPKTEYVDLSKVSVTGTPIRRELLEGENEGAKESLGLTFERPVLLFLGGSQGAQALNEFVLSLLTPALQEYEIIHACGEGNVAAVLQEAQLIIEPGNEKYYHCFGFLDEAQLKHAYKAANLVVSRAGSGTIFEIAANGKPSILIPLPSAAGDHQSKNAYAYAAAGAALVIEQGNLTPHFFLGEIDSILSNPQKLRAMQESALRFSKPLAAAAIAREILEYLHA